MIRSIVSAVPVFMAISLLISACADELVATNREGTVLKHAYPQGWKSYENSRYKFRLDHPPLFVIQPQNVAKLAQFTPVPIEVIFIMNPTMAAGELAGIEPPDLQLRVYSAEGANSLQDWLASTGITSAESINITKPYQNAGMTGVEVCSSTMIAPGCSIYLMQHSYIYQLTPMSQEGDTIIRTFTFTGK